MSEESQQTDASSKTVIPEVEKSESYKKKKAQQERSSKQTKANSAGKKSLVFFSLLLNLVLIAGLVYLGINQLELEKSVGVLFGQQNQFVRERSSMLTNIEALGSTLLDVENQRTAASVALTKLMTEQSNELGRLNLELISVRLRVNASGGAVNQEWLFVEVESLLRLAQQRLLVARDVRAAIALFVASDDILRQINDSAVFSIRDILASDLIALRAIVEIDVPGLYLRLGSLAEQVDSLSSVAGPQQLLVSSRQIISAQETAVQGEAAGYFDRLLKKIGEYIVVRRRDEPIQPLLTLEQGFYIKQNIRLYLEQSRLALLRENVELYQNNIEQAMNGIEEYLSSDGVEKQNILFALNELHDTQISIQIPNVSNTLNALRQVTGSDVLIVQETVDQEATSQETDE